MHTNPGLWASVAATSFVLVAVATPTGPLVVVAAPAAGVPTVPVLQRVVAERSLDTIAVPELPKRKSVTPQPVPVRPLHLDQLQHHVHMDHGERVPLRVAVERNLAPTTVATPNHKHVTLKNVPVRLAHGVPAVVVVEMERKVAQTTVRVAVSKRSPATRVH